MAKKVENNGDLFAIQYKDEQHAVEFKLDGDGETLWSTTKHLADLFDCTIQNIDLHIKNIFKDKELLEESVIKEFLITATDGKQYNTKHYNLDMIIG